MPLKALGKTTDARINVLEIIGNADKGGMENYLKGFIENLPSKFNLIFICPYESEFTSTLRKLGIKHIYIARIEDDPYWRSIQLATEVGKLHHIHILHAHMPKAHLLAGLAGNLLQRPVVATIHGMDITAHELGIARAVNSHLITNNQEAYIQAIAMGVPAGHLQLVRNGINLSDFNVKANGIKIRNQFNIPSTVPVIGFVGRLDHEKGPDQFLKAARLIRNEQPLAQFVVVGEGSMNKELQKLCTDLQLTSCVHFMKWQTDTWNIYPAFDILAHTSRSDGTSLVLMEAMACGVPTVAIRVGGVPEVVEHGSSGWLVNDWEMLAERIIELTDKPQTRRKMSEAAVSRVKNLFNVKTNTEKVGHILEELVLDHVNGFNLPEVILKQNEQEKLLSSPVLK